MVESLRPHDNITWRTRIAPWIIEATETHSETIAKLLYRYYLQYYAHKTVQKYLHSEANTRIYFGGGSHHQQGSQFHGPKTPLLSCIHRFISGFLLRTAYVTLPTYVNNVLNSYMCIVMDQFVDNNTQKMQY
jgi:hypothetical protein